MTELKTLKDIGGTTHVFKRWIKEEAIKWIKSMDKVKIQESIDCKEVFRNFFNISTDDLTSHKDKK